MNERVHVVQDRNCRGCTLCCKLLSVEELEKPPGVWCGCCDQGTGCKIYPDRPTECRNFYCGYLVDPDLDDRWKPSTCKLVVAFQEDGNSVEVHVDSARLHAWQEEPFYSQINKWAIAASQRQAHVIVWEGDTKIVVSSPGTSQNGGRLG